MTIENVVIVGLGYIGLPTAAALATQGVSVVGIDINPVVVDAVNRGEVPFVEPDLAIAVSGAVSQGYLTAQTEIPEADAYIIAVPTPFTVERDADISYIRSAAETIAPVLRMGNLVILESTSPPGTTRQLRDWLVKLRPDLTFPGPSSGRRDISIAHCPERVLPGRIMIEMVTNDRVIGGVTPECAQHAAALYEIFCQGHLALTDADSAEMAKLVENAYRDVNIAFANEISIVCEHLQLDTWEVIRMANRHPRVDILSPGPGVGGHCIAVDPWFIISKAPEQTKLMRAAREVNDRKPLHIVTSVVERAGRIVRPTIACLGMAFKANIDDLRESPSIQIIEDLSDQLPEAKILAVEPHVAALPASFETRTNVSLAKTDDAIDEADIVLLLVDHSQFRSIKRSRLEGKSVFDTRGLWR